MKKIIPVLAATLLLYSCISVGPTARITFDAPNLYPEGIAWDPAANVYYVSSARTGTIGKVTPDGIYSILHADSLLKSSYGMKLHPDGKRLFVCVADANYSKFTTADTRKKMSRVIAIDVNTGRRVADINLAPLYQGERFANDLAFDDKGNCYVTESYSNVVLKIDAAGTPSVFSRSPLFTTGGIGLNGIVYHPGGFLLVNSTGKGSLFKIDINNPTNVQIVKSGMFMLGADGMLLNDENHITVVVNGGQNKIFKLKTEDNWKSAKLDATTLVVDRFAYPSTATFRGDETWIMNTKFHELNDSVFHPSQNFAIQKAVLKPIPSKLAE